MAIKILLAEDHTIVREGLRAIIEKEPEMEVIGEAQDGLKVIWQAVELKPDVVIMDINMPGVNGIEATRRIKAKMSDVKVLALSVHYKSEYVLDMLDAGVSGYLLKDCFCTELIEAIERVVKGESYLSPKITSIVLDDRKNKDSLPDIVLNENEKKLVRFLANGKSAKEIADEDKANVKTIEARRRRIMKKLEIDNLAGLVMYAIREGLRVCSFNCVNGLNDS